MSFPSLTGSYASSSAPARVRTGRGPDLTEALHRGPAGSALEEPQGWRPGRPGDDYFAVRRSHWRCRSVHEPGAVDSRRA